MPIAEGLDMALQSWTIKFQHFRQQQKWHYVFKAMNYKEGEGREGVLG